MAFNLFSKKTKNEETTLFHRADTLEMVHPEVTDLLWLADGAHKNFEGKTVSDVIRAGSVEIPVSVSGEMEPSLISVKLKVGTLPESSREQDKVPNPPKNSSYESLTPDQRGVFWTLLEEPYRLYYHANYISILSSGLERHMFCGNYEKAHRAFMNLRATQTERDFSTRSANIIILMALYHNRPDLLLEWQDSLDVDHTYHYSADINVLAMYGLEMGLQARDMMRMAKEFGMVDNRYAMYYYPHFLRYLTENIRAQFGTETLPMSEILTKEKIGAAPKVSVPVFTNSCFAQADLTIPALTKEPELRKTVYDLLMKTEQDVKSDIQDLRDRGLLLYDIDHDRKPYEVDKDGYIIA